MNDEILYQKKQMAVYPMDNGRISLDEVMRALGQNAYTIDQLWLDHAALWQQLGWNESQVKLWLGCLGDVRANLAESGEKIYRVEVRQQGDRQSLADHVLSLLENAGKPLPLAHLRDKLPAGWVVTEAMLRAAVKADARLELKGPLVKTK